MGDMIRYKRIYYDVIIAYIIRYINEKRREVNFSPSWYPDPGSNRDGLLHWCLRPARLPIPPSGQIPPCLFAVAKVLIIFELTNFLVTFFSKNAFLMQKH